MALPISGVPIAPDATGQLAGTEPGPTGTDQARPPASHALARMGRAIRLVRQRRGVRRPGQRGEYLVTEAHANGRSSGRCHQAGGGYDRHGGVPHWPGSNLT